MKKLLITRALFDLFTDLKEIKAEGKPTHPKLQIIDKEGNNLIHTIIQTEDSQLFKLENYIPLLVKLGVNVNHKNWYTLTPLLLAVRLQYGEALKQLFKAGADLTATDLDGNNILDHALLTDNKQIINLVCVLLNLKSISLTAGIYLIVLSESNLSTVQKAKNWADEHKIITDINKMTPGTRRTALMTAAQNRKADIVRYLLELKADVFLQDREGLNALMHAILKGDQEIMEMILESGGSRLINENSRIFKINALHLAVEKNKDIDVIKKLLDYKADINLEDHEANTVLYKAIFLNIEPTIDLLLAHPSLDAAQFTNAVRCLGQAIRECPVLVLDKLLQRPDFFSKIDDEAGLSLYRLAINLKKDDHCHILIKYRVNVGLKFKNPLSLFCYRGKKDMIKRMFSLHRDQIPPLAIVMCLANAIQHNKKGIFFLILDSIGGFEKFSQQFSEGRSEYMNYIALACVIKRGWLDLALQCQPKLKFFIGSPLFSEIEPSYLTQSLAYLQGSLKFLTSHRLKSHTLISHTVIDERKWTTCFPEMVNRIPWLRDYTPNSNDPDQWQRFVAAPSSQNSNLSPIPITEPRTTFAMTPFAFFTCQGWRPEQIHPFLQETKTPKPIKTKSLMLMADIKQSNCSWLTGQITNQDQRLRRLENSSAPNSFLFIPEILKEELPINTPFQKRYHFHPKNTKPLSGLPPVKIIMQFSKDNIIQYRTTFAIELIYPGEDRMLCVKIMPDNPHQRGTLYLAVHYLKGGLHHHRTPLPTLIKLDMSDPSPYQSPTLGGQ